MTLRPTAVLRFGVFLLSTLLSCSRERSVSEQDLRAAYASLVMRPVELRLTDFPHVARAVFTRSEEKRADALRAAASRTLRNSGGSVRLRAAAQTFLRRPVAAAQTIETALRSNDRDAKLWNDLAVHRFEMARNGDDPRALGEALVAVDRAIALDIALAEAAFNRAAILEAMNLRGIAAKAWQIVAAEEDDKRWAAEARQRAAAQPLSRYESWQKARVALEDAAVRGDVERVDAMIAVFAQDTRTQCEGPALASWAESHLGGHRSEAARQLRIAHVVGDRLFRISGEALIRDAVVSIEDAARSGRENTIAKAHAQYKRARMLIHDRQPGAAEKLMEEAERLFRAANSPMQLVARSYRVGIAFDRNRIVDATVLLDDLEQGLRTGYHAMRAQVEWDRARIASRRGDVYALLQHSQRAAAIYTQLREHDSAIQMQSFVASALTTLGRAADAWRARLKTFADATASGHPDLLEHVLHAAAKEEILDDRYEVAASLFAIMLSEPQRSPVRHFEGLLWQAFVSTRTRDRNANLQSLADAAHAIEDDELRATANADRWLVEALLIRDAHPSDAVELLSRTIDARRSRGLGEVLPAAYLVRGQTYRRMGDEKRAEADLNAALTLLEERREHVATVALRDSFFASADAVCVELMDLYAKRRDFTSTYYAAERCRARSLTDVAGDRIARVEPLSENLLRRLPDGTALLHYSVVRERLIILLLERSRLQGWLIPISRDALEQESASLIAAMERGDAASADRFLRRLYDTLIAPIAKKTEGKRLVISPDAALTNIPFAALRSGSGRYLVENATISMTPSGSAYLTAPRVPYAEAARALFVGDPAFDTRVHDLPRLSHADAETRELANVHPDAVLLTGAAATHERFLQELAASDLVHVAAHAVISPRDAASSTIVLAPSDGDNGLLYQSSIADLRLARKPLVVLAGCRTASAAGGRGSIRSIALAFLAAGSRGVIGSLWNLDDRATRYVSGALHRHLGAATASDAVRNTQLEMLGSSNPTLRAPEVWAAFQHYGFHGERRGQ